MARYRPWLKDIAIWLGDLRDDPRIAKRTQRVLKWGGQVHRRRQKLPSHSILLEDESRSFPPCRPLQLFEKYELVVAIHNAVCENTPRIMAFDPRTSIEKGGAALAVDFAIDHWCRRVAYICDDQFNRIRNDVRAVAADLRVKPPELTRPESVEINVIVQNAPAGDGKSNGATRKKSGGRRRKRPTRAELTPQEAKVMKLDALRWTGPQIAKELGITRQRVGQLRRSAEKRQAPSSRSVNLRKAGSLHANTSTDHRAIHQG